MLKKMCSLVLCLIMVTVAFIAVPFSASANAVIIPATVRLEPETLNLARQGVFTAFITLLAAYDIADIDFLTVECEGASAVRGKVAGNKFIAKFNRQDIDGVPVGDAVTLTVTDEVDGTPFEGSDTIRVINRGGT